MVQDRFKVEDELICVQDPSNQWPIRYQDTGGYGAGWRLGKIVKISSITYPSDQYGPIYWPTDGQGGIYENFLRKNPKEWD